MAPVLRLLSCWLPGRKIISHLMQAYAEPRFLPTLQAEGRKRPKRWPSNVAVHS